MTYIKLTRADGTTLSGMQWYVGVTNRATGKGNKLCTDGVLHVYDTPEQAAFMRPAHVRRYTRSWEVRSRCKGFTDGTKRGIKSCTVVREIRLPEITVEQRVEIAIRASLLVYSEPSYTKWANRWLCGENRAADAAYIAYLAAASTNVDATTAAAYAAYAAYADAAAHLDRPPYPAYAADYGTGAAESAARSSSYAAMANKGIDLQSIIEEVLG